MEDEELHMDANNATGLGRPWTRTSGEGPGRIPATRTSAARGHDPKTVLLAQDDQDSLEIFGVVLRGAGYRVLTADRGEDALRLALEEEPDLVFTDARLPFVDGWRLIEVLRGEPALAAARFVLLTAWVERDQAQRAREAGFDAYIPKPVEPMRLLREAQRLIGPTLPTHQRRP